MRLRKLFNAPTTIINYKIDCTISRIVSAGDADWVTGRPITMKSLPFSIASIGVTTRRWSSEGELLKRIPGVTKIKFSFLSFLSMGTSLAEHTTPSSPLISAAEDRIRT